MEDEIHLTTEQKEAYELISLGHNVFVTGLGGTGKSTLIRYILSNMYSRKIAVTSSTGISATLIGGVTFHSFCGIGLGRESAETLLENMSYKAKKRWLSTQMIVIDEVSMITPELLNKTNEIAKTVRKCNLPFGGLQVVFCGDFLQLPCIGSDTFCFDSDAWREISPIVVCLTTNVRQKSDKVFQKVLEEIRMGIVTDESKKILKSRLDIEEDVDGTEELKIESTKLFCTNSDVSRINADRLASLATPKWKYSISFDWKNDRKPFWLKDEDTVRKQFVKNLIAEEKLELCVGAQVMLLANIDVDAGLANGSRGVVVSVDEETKLPTVLFKNGMKEAVDFWEWTYKLDDDFTLCAYQLPLKLAWALTVHKSQGATLDSVELDLTDMFEYGQGYVALSRVRDLESLRLTGISFSKIRAHPKALEFYARLKEKN
jgi:ATP-dependent DNA helicase PIF1